MAVHQTMGCNAPIALEYKRPPQGCGNAHRWKIGKVRELPMTSSWSIVYHSPPQSISKLVQFFEELVSKKVLLKKMMLHEN